VSTSGVTYVQGLDSGNYEFTHVVATVTASGDTVVYTPSAGKRIRVYWSYAITDPGSSASPLIKIILGGTEKFRVYALSKRQQMTGPVDGTLVVNLSTAASVAVTFVLEEVGA
jgi:hypothetical protein